MVASAPGCAVWAACDTNVCPWKCDGGDAEIKLKIKSWSKNKIREEINRADCPPESGTFRGILSKRLKDIEKSEKKK
jgi:hypothetical protein